MEDSLFRTFQSLFDYNNNPDPGIYIQIQKSLFIICSRLCPQAWFSLFQNRFNCEVYSLQVLPSPVLLMAALSTASIFNKQKLYSYLLQSTVKTLILFSGIAVSLFIWNFIYRRITSFISGNPYLGIYDVRARQILGKEGTA